MFISTPRTTSINQLDDLTPGSIVVADKVTGVLKELPPGTAGDSLVTQGPGEEPLWASAVPIGTVLMFAASITGVPALPSGWQLCDGTVFPSGPMSGQNAPALNNTNRFPRPNTSSGGIGGAATHQHSVPEGGPNQVVSYSSGPRITYENHQHDSKSNIPPFYDLVFIIRFE